MSENFSENESLNAPEKGDRTLYSLPEKMNIAQLAHCFKMDRRTISDRLSAANLPYEPGPKGSKLYDVHSALPVMYSTGLKGNIDVDAETDKEKLLLTRLKREAAEIELQLARREAVPIKEVLDAVKREYEFVRAQVRALPSSMLKKIAVQMDLPQIFKILTDAVDAALSELQYDAQLCIEAANKIEVVEVKTEKPAEAPVE